MNKKFIIFVFIGLVILTLLTPFWVFKDLLFPFVTSKAFYLRILVELALPFYLFLFLRYPQYRPSFKNPLTISIVAFFLFNLVSGIFGVNPLRSIWGNFERMGGVFYLGHLCLLYFYVLMIGQINARYLRLFLQMLLAIGVAVSLDGVMVRLTHNNFLLNDPSYPRVSGTFGNPIFIASFLVVPLFISAFFAVSADALWKKIIYWAFVLLQAWVIFLSETRGAVVGLGIGIFVAAVLYVILNPVKKIKIWGGAAVAVFVVVVGLLFALHSHLPQGGLLHRVFNLKDTNTEARLIQWGIALKGYKDAPILGVGPENYYFISNKYYNPVIYQYDPSWFDKPHNYLIEVLVTSGIFGFTAYLSVLAFSFWALWLALREKILLLSEFCLLVGGLITYQIQNLFVFDTVGASMAFFIYIGFMAYLLYEASGGASAAKTDKLKGLDPLFCNVAFGLSIAIVLYVVYLANITGMQVAKDINYGYAYSTVNPQTAKNYFEAADNSPFDFDPIQFSSKYADFATSLASSPPQGTSNQFVSQNIQDAIDAQQEAINRVSNDPTAWQELANLYLTQSIFNKTALDPKAVLAAQTAMDLAPRRPEPQEIMARLDLSQNNLAGAETIYENITSEIPQDNQAKLQLALIYYYDNQQDKALQLAQQVLATGYMPTATIQISWMGALYDKENNFAAAVNIYQLDLKIDPSDLQDEWSLAQDEAKLGNKAQAIAIAQSLITSDPTDASHFRDFINSLK
jgi:O-antigen ligase